MMDATDAATRIQATFRGKRCRDLHVERVRRGLPWSPFVPARMEAVAAMLEVAKLQPGDVLLDVGSGDGRVVLAALEIQPRLGAALGVEIDPTLVTLSRRRAHERSHDSGRVQILSGDWADVDMRHVDVVVLFFLPHKDLASMLQARLRPGTRVITYVFEIPNWVPEAVVETVPFMTTRGTSRIFRYRVPPSAPTPMAA